MDAEDAMCRWVNWLTPFVQPSLLHYGDFIHNGRISAVLVGESSTPSLQVKGFNSSSSTSLLQLHLMEKEQIACYQSHVNKDID